MAPLIRQLFLNELALRLKILQSVFQNVPVVADFHSKTANRVTSQIVHKYSLFRGITLW
ncbi:MAG: hypothetical protein AAF222_00085 [Pseudomonadota bacterium]